MSAGERQRLALARVLLAGADILLLDEPTAHIDPLTSGQLLSELLTACGQRSLLLVSHDHEVAGSADTVIELEAGRVVATRSGKARSGGSPHQKLPPVPPGPTAGTRRILAAEHD